MNGRGQRWAGKATGRKTLNRVLILNQFGLPRSEDGITRHVDLFDQVDGWDFRLIAGHLNHYSQQPIRTADDRFVFVRVPRYKGAGARRVASWVLYVTQAIVAGVALGRPHVVYASSPHLLTPLAGAVIASFWRRPLVVEVRDLWPETLVEAGALRRHGRLHRVLVALESWIYARADRLVAVTTGWQEHFATFGISDNEVAVISNGTDVKAASAGKDQLREFYEIAGVTAIYAGAHGPTNGLDSILDAAHDLPDLTFLLVGAGPEKERLTRRAIQENLNNVKFRKPVPKSELLNLLSACDIGIHTVSPLPVLRLGMSPNKIFDYLAAGLPVVSNAGPGLARVLNHDQCALVGEVDSLQSSLRQLIHEGHKERAKRGESGRRLVRQQFSRHAAATKMRKLLTGISHECDQ